MKKQELTNLRTKTPDELAKLLSDKEKELSETQVKIASGTEKNIKKGFGLRKDIAQIATLMREKEILERKEV